MEASAQPRRRRAIRIANCSGAVPDPGDHMYTQALHGQVDVITGDYLAEINLANDAEAYAKGEHPGWIPTAWDGLEKAVELAEKKGIKIVINGGGLNPRGLAEKTHEFLRAKGLGLKVAYVLGDDCLCRVQELLAREDGVLPHLDERNASVRLAEETKEFFARSEEMPVVSANAYLGMRAIRRGLDLGADIVICGRVADASPVIAAAAWWHQWADDDFDALAGALIAGHLIECSTYITGANFAGFGKYKVEELLNLGLPIVEVEADGSCVVTKHEELNGFVTRDTVICQLLYELQGKIYLNSDVKGDIEEIRVEEEGKDRVRVTGTKGAPPPATTKLAVFYKAGWQCELLVNATGYATEKKFRLQEAQLRGKLKEWGVVERFDVLDFQWVGRPQPNPTCQLASTTYLRIFAQAREREVVAKVLPAWAYNAMQHFAGFHNSLDMRTALPRPFLGFYPAIISQSELEESINVIDPKTGHVSTTKVRPPRHTQHLQPREDYDPSKPMSPESFGETILAPLGDIALGRSGDKGANVNCGLYVHTDEEWAWFRSFMTRSQMRIMMGTDWQDWYHLERCEFPHIKAVHFVIYGPLGRGVSSSKLLDALGKGFAEFIRDVHVPIPRKFLEGRTSGSRL